MCRDRQTDRHTHTHTHTHTHYGYKLLCELHHFLIHPKYEVHMSKEIFSSNDNAIETAKKQLSCV